MTLQEIKSNFHLLIDEVEDPKLLRQFYELLKSLGEKKSKVDFWELFTEEQKKELELIWEESEDEKTLIENEVVMDKAKKW